MIYVDILIYTDRFFFGSVTNDYPELLGKIIEILEARVQGKYRLRIIARTGVRVEISGQFIRRLYKQNKSGDKTRRTTEIIFNLYDESAYTHTNAVRLV